MSNYQTIEFIDNPAIAGREDQYVSITVDVLPVVKSWKESLFSFEWLDNDGRIKKIEGLPEHDQPKRKDIEDKLAKMEPIPKAVLGIGMQENIEIGIGRAEFLTLVAHGIRNVEVHIPKSNEEDFKSFLA